MATDELIARAIKLRAEEWPIADLEAVEACPVCDNADRSLLYDDVWDGSFLTAPGYWSLWRCEKCRSAYLDPRPTQASIGRAYAQYYTHVASAAIPLKTGLARIKEMIGNGYRNGRYGTSLEPSSKLGMLVGNLVPSTRRQIDQTFRFLPHAAEPGRRLLDVGCGAGDYLAVASQAGWDCFGADPDPAAAAIGTSRGFEVRQGGIEAWHDSLGSFDAVTMNHVIEHVPDPRETIEAVFALLKPGGQFYCDTPNLDAVSLAAFGPDWRGLETPRHLVLFSYDALYGLLRDAGFVTIRQEIIPSPLPFLIAESERMMATNAPGSRVLPTDVARLKDQPTGPNAEFLTFTCRRPG